MAKRNKKFGKRFFSIPKMPDLHIPWGTIRRKLRDWCVSGWQVSREPARRTGRHLFALGAFVFVVLLIHHELLAVLKSDRRYTIDPGPGPVVKRPNWVGAGENPGPGAMVDGPKTLLDEDLVGRVGRSLEKNPWVRRVISVDRVFPDSIRVRYEVRQPQLAVWLPQGYVLVDADKVRLPGQYSDLPVALELPVVGGVRGEAPEAGKVWKNKTLDACREMARLCRDVPVLAALRVDRVEMLSRSENMVLQTQSGCNLYWGKAPAMAGAGELPIEEKIGHLRRVLSHYPGLAGLQEVTVFGRRPTILKRDFTNARGR